MQLAPHSFLSGSAPALSLALLVALTPASVIADETSGDWSGQIELRGNYYWETSTRVIAPSLNASVESPSGVRLHADYLVDSITSASQAAGTLVDVGFTEVRHDVGGGIGYEFDLGESQLDLSANVRFSYEPDYFSTGGFIGSALSLNRRNTVLRLNLALVQDDIRQVLRGAQDRIGPDGRNLSDRGEVGELWGLVASAGFEQVLSPTVTFQLGYDFGRLSGFLANPYRMVSVQGVLQPEAHPELRLRHTLHSRLAVYARRLHAAFHFRVRGYMDSWEVQALSPEFRWYQELGAFAQLRSRYRFYRQSRAFFGVPAEAYTEADVFVTADPKMTAFDNHLLGFQLRLNMSFLNGTTMHALRRSSLTFGFEYIWNTNRYGNGVISQLGLQLPF